MKNNPHENPDLTAYALGELHARQARDIHALLADCPVAAHELEQIEAVTDALRQGAPIPQERLRPEQRHAVLYPSNLPKRSAPLMPRPLPRRSPMFRTVVTGVLKTAAVVAVTGAAYLVGRHVSLEDSAATMAVEENASQGGAENNLAASAPSVPASPEVRAAGPNLPDVAKTAVPLVADTQPASPVEKEPVVVLQPATAPEAMAPAATAIPAVVSAKPVEKTTAPAPAVVAVRPPSVTTPGRHQNFVNASRQAADHLSIHPGQIRPLPPKAGKGALLAAPLPLQNPSSGSKDAGKPRAADLYLHSWKAEVVTCPWDESRRLLRVTLQLPADQPAVSAGGSYKLQVNFDPNNVREYRQLCERHQPAAELRTAGTHVIWYEYLPNGSPDASKTVATLTLDKARFTTQAVGPFDESKLNVQDRGATWQNAREDFVFDTAVVGFGLLMRGIPQAPKLDHALVLSLAERSPLSATDAERTRFIRLVKEAALAAGL